MKIADANVVLRYLLNDTESLADKATELLENNDVYIPNEVIAEIVYVLEKVYKVNRKDISYSLIELFNYKNLDVDDIDVIVAALNMYSERKLDFVDTLLYAYNKVRGHEIYTFDRKLNNLLKND